MPENQRIGKKIKENSDLEKRVLDLEKAVKALLVGMKQVEIEVDEYVMPKGELYGIDFE